MTEQNEQFLIALCNRILYLCQIRGISPERIAGEIPLRNGQDIRMETLMGIRTDEIEKIAGMLGVGADFLPGKPGGSSAEVEYIVYLLRRL